MKKTYLYLLCLLAPSVIAAKMQTSITYCPAIKDIEAMCQSNLPYDQDKTPFPACLMYEVGDAHVFYGNQRWRLSSFRPPSLHDPLIFDKANIDHTGTHCIYRTAREGHYIRFSLDKHTKLLPYDTTDADNYWKDMLAGKHHGLAADSAPSGNIFTCKLSNACHKSSDGKQVCPTTKINIHNCPFKNWHPAN